MAGKGKTFISEATGKGISAKGRSRIEVEASKIVTVKSYKVATTSNDQSRWIERAVTAWCAKTDVVLGHFPTVTKAMQTLTGFSKNGASAIIDRFKKDGTRKTFKHRTGRGYLTSLTDYKKAVR